MLINTLEWAKRKKQKVYNKVKTFPDSKHLHNECLHWTIIVDILTNYDIMVNRKELLYKLKKLEPFNNTNIPTWIESIIKDAKI